MRAITFHTTTGAAAASRAAAGRPVSAPTDRPIDHLTTPQTGVRTWHA